MIALRTLAAWFELFLAKLFGKPKLVYDGDDLIQAVEYRGKTHFLDDGGKE
jgi:hypothetical protein